jgi:hypothetical protein
MCKCYEDHQWRVNGTTQEKAKLHVWRDSSKYWWYSVRVKCVRCEQTDTHLRCLGKKERSA